MWRQFQIGTLVLFVIFAVLTIYCQLRCGMLGGAITRGESTEDDLARMSAQGKRAAIGAVISLAACMVFGALGMR